MSNAKLEFSVETVRELLVYDEETGVITWRVDRGKRKAGDVAGCVEKASGYHVIRVAGRLERAHRLAYMLMNGELPKGQVRHADKNKLNNRWQNLVVKARTEQVQDVAQAE
jgi:citrate synthase